MDLVTPVLIGIALAMDCLAVSLAIGTSTKANLLKTALIIALCFGSFQAGMTLVGWAAGTGLTVFIAGFDHWVAFILLAVIGAKMIHEGLETGEEEEKISNLAFVPVMLLSFATSIDALAVGVSFAFLHMDVLMPALIIGIVAFIFSCAGVLSGIQLKSVLGKRIEIAGGLILIAIGLNILLSHMIAG
ncbi:manganese efflux pump MntP [Methanoregula formicica]|uniref:Putative manganese efflux pump MntP n=1 Tax=Methanoregula formicica (strain DSM 22288 / NBRC 105244 / SMSP) TaxID=593750 RepID=L0HH14_METFS|nr:manganese efflux pump MntP family protein [Methanoregula formicica]AGB03071.1 putative membrane protein [Methanoregula formicica SMSP]